jgi:hypothetical protein
MSLFQLITVPLTVLLGVRSLFRLVRGERPRWRALAGAGIWFAAAAAILRPEATTGIAMKLGIGRGADLVLYVVAISFIAAFFYLYQRIRKLESGLTVIVRRMAIDDAHHASLPPNENANEVPTPADVPDPGREP